MDNNYTENVVTINPNSGFCYCVIFNNRTVKFGRASSWKHLGGQIATHIGSAARMGRQVVVVYYKRSNNTIQEESKILEFASTLHQRKTGDEYFVDVTKDFVQTIVNRYEMHLYREKQYQYSLSKDPEATVDKTTVDSQNVTDTSKRKLTKLTNTNFRAQNITIWIGVIFWALSAAVNVNSGIYLGSQIFQGLGILFGVVTAALMVPILFPLLSTDKRTTNVAPGLTYVSHLLSMLLLCTQPVLSVQAILGHETNEAGNVASRVAEIEKQLAQRQQAMDSIVVGISPQDHVKKLARVSYQIDRIGGIQAKNWNGHKTGKTLKEASSHFQMSNDYCRFKKLYKKECLEVHELRAERQHLVNVIDSLKAQDVVAEKKELRKQYDKLAQEKKELHNSLGGEDGTAANTLLSLVKRWPVMEMAIYLIVVFIAFLFEWTVHTTLSIRALKPPPSPTPRGAKTPIQEKEIEFLQDYKKKEKGEKGKKKKEKGKRKRKKEKLKGKWENLKEFVALDNTRRKVDINKLIDTVDWRYYLHPKQRDDYSWNALPVFKDKRRQADLVALQKILHKYEPGAPVVCRLLQDWTVYYLDDGTDKAGELRRYSDTKVRSTFLVALKKLGLTRKEGSRTFWVDKEVGGPIMEKLR